MDTTVCVTSSKLIPISSRYLPQTHCVSKETGSTLESMNNGKHHSNTESFIFLAIAKHSPSLTHQKLTELLHFPP